VASLFLSKELTAWKFHLTGDILSQISSNSEVLDLPLMSVRSADSLSIGSDLSKQTEALNTQLGFDLIYHTPYYSYLYMPATGRFFRQQTATTGNYPFVNVFLNLKLKRTRIFIMFDQVNAGMQGYEYCMIPHIQ
jgi:hypothetical protein